MLSIREEKETDVLANKEGQLLSERTWLFFSIHGKTQQFDTHHLIKSKHLPQSSFSVLALLFDRHLPFTLSPCSSIGDAIGVHADLVVYTCQSISLFESVLFPRLVLTQFLSNIAHTPKDVDL